MATTDSTSLLTPNANFVRASVVPVLNTTPYSAGDAMHTNDLKMQSMSKDTGGGVGVIRSVLLIDDDDQAATCVLWLFDAALAATTHTINVAFDINDTDADAFVGAITIDTYVDGTSNQLGQEFPNLYYKTLAGSTDLYAVLETSGTPTHTASGLELIIIAEYL